MPRALALDGDIRLPVTPSYRSADGSDLPARVAKAGAEFETYNGRRPSQVLLGRVEWEELRAILLTERKFDIATSLPPGRGVLLTVAGIRVVRVTGTESLLEAV